MISLTHFQLWSRMHVISGIPSTATLTLNSVNHIIFQSYIIWRLFSLDLLSLLFITVYGRQLLNSDCSFAQF